MCKLFGPWFVLLLKVRIALCSLYLLFGIAMIAMSFNLVQEQVINNVKELGRQLGILKDDDEEEEYWNVLNMCIHFALKVHVRLYSTVH